MLDTVHLNVEEPHIYDSVTKNMNSNTSAVYKDSPKVITSLEETKILLICKYNNKSTTKKQSINKISTKKLVKLMVFVQNNFNKLKLPDRNFISMQQFIQQTCWL